MVDIASDVASENDLPCGLTVTYRPGCVIVTVHGDLGHAAAAGLRRLLFDPTVCDQPTVVVDLCDVGRIGSAAIGGLVAARRWHQARGATMPLVVARTGAVRDVLTAAPLRSVFDLLDLPAAVPRR